MMPGMPDLQALLQQAQQMQADMAQAQADLASAEITGHSGGGLVSATVTGDGQLKGLVIDPSVVDPSDVETLADLIIAAVRDAGRAAAEVAEQKMGAVAGPAAGFDLSAFGLPALDGFPAEDDDDEFADEYTDDDDDDDDDGAAQEHDDAQEDGAAQEHGATGTSPAAPRALPPTQSGA